MGTSPEAIPADLAGPRGTPNKVNALLKEDIAEAYHQRGGIEWLKTFQDRDFVRLLEKTMPREVAADVSMRAKREEAPVTVTFKIGPPLLPGSETPPSKDVRPQPCSYPQNPNKILFFA